MKKNEKRTMGTMGTMEYPVQAINPVNLSKSITPLKDNNQAKQEIKESKEMLKSSILEQAEKTIEAKIKQESVQRLKVSIWKNNDKTCQICLKSVDFNKSNNDLESGTTHCKLCDYSLLIEKLNDEIRILKAENAILKGAPKGK